MLAIPAGIESDGVQGKVSVRNLLPGVFTTITVPIDHYSPALHYFNADQYKPICRANLTQVTGNGIHHPKALSLFSQVLGAICQQVPAADTVVLLCAGEIAQLCGIDFFHCCVLLLLNDYSFVSDSQMDNRHLVTR